MQSTGTGWRSRRAEVAVVTVGMQALYRLPRENSKLHEPCFLHWKAVRGMTRA